MLDPRDAAGVPLFSLQKQFAYPPNDPPKGGSATADWPSRSASFHHFALTCGHRYWLSQQTAGFE